MGQALAIKTLGVHRLSSSCFTRGSGRDKLAAPTQRKPTVSLSLSSSSLSLLAAAEAALAALGLTVEQAAHLRLAADLCEAWREATDAGATDAASPLALAEEWAEDGEGWDASHLVEGAAALLAD